MKRVLILACVAVGLNPCSAARAAGEPLVLDVWPGEAVGDHGQIGSERVLAAAEAPTKDAKVRGSELARHDRPPRKVIVGTTMTRWYSDHPGLSGRLEQMRRLIDEMVAESRSRYGRSIDLALFTEYAVTAGKSGTAAEVAVPLNDTIIGALASKAREHNTYIVFGGVFRDDPATAACSNAAVVIDRQGRPAHHDRPGRGPAPGRVEAQDLLGGRQLPDRRGEHEPEQFQGEMDP